MALFIAGWLGTVIGRKGPAHYRINSENPELNGKRPIFGMGRLARLRPSSRPFRSSAVTGFAGRHGPAGGRATRAEGRRGATAQLRRGQATRAGAARPDARHGLRASQADGPRGVAR